MSKDMKFQKKLVKELNSNKELAYQDTSIYTVLLDLVQGNSIEEVFMMLHNVATDLKKRKNLKVSLKKQSHGSGCEITPNGFLALRRWGFRTINLHKKIIKST